MGERSEEGVKVVLGSGVSHPKTNGLQDRDLKLEIFIGGQINARSGHESSHGESFGDFSLLVDLGRKGGTLMARERQAMKRGIILFYEIPGERASTESK